MSSQTFTLLKFLTEAAGQSRRKMSDAIKQGRVQVNRKIAEDFRQPIDPTKDSITLDSNKVQPPKHKMVYLMLNKPAGIVTTSADEYDRKTVIDILPDQYNNLRLHAIGRLDMDSIGLLLLTNDGALTYRLTHPKFEHPKEYYVNIKGYLKSAEKIRLENGMRLEDGKTHPAKIKTVRGSPDYNYSLTIHEGRKRQIRRMFETLGHPVQALKRVRMGNLQLGDLPEGEVRELTQDEIASLSK